jgi:hypothetical protein
MQANLLPLTQVIGGAKIDDFKFLAVYGNLSVRGDHRWGQDQPVTGTMTDTAMEKSDILKGVARMSQGEAAKEPHPVAGHPFSWGTS